MGLREEIVKSAQKLYDYSWKDESPNEVSFICEVLKNTSYEGELPNCIEDFSTLFISTSKDDELNGDIIVLKKNKCLIKIKPCMFLHYSDYGVRMEEWNNYWASLYETTYRVKTVVNSSVMTKIINAQAKLAGVEPLLIRAIIESTSNYDPNIKGGLMGLGDNNVKEHIAQGARLVKRLLDKHGGDENKSIIEFAKDLNLATKIIAIYKKLKPP